MGRNPVRRREEEDKIGIGTTSNDNNQGGFWIVVFIIMCHSCFFMSNFLKSLLQFFCPFFTFYLAIKEYYFSNYYQYLLDYPSGSEDDDSNFVVEQPHETQDNNSHVIDSDMVLSSSDSDESSLSGNDQKDCGHYCY
jgi:hypothetical protein